MHRRMDGWVDGWMISLEVFNFCLRQGWNHLQNLHHFLVNICAATKSLTLFHSMALHAQEKHLVSILKLQVVIIRDRHNSHPAARLTVQLLR